jgi:hypothetical protein
MDEIIEAIKYAGRGRFDRLIPTGPTPYREVQRMTQFIIGYPYGPRHE